MNKSRQQRRAEERKLNKPRHEPLEFENFDQFMANTEIMKALNEAVQSNALNLHSNMNKLAEVMKKHRKTVRQVMEYNDLPFENDDD